MPGALARYDDLMTEAEVCRRYPHLLSEKELRGARQRKEISFVSGKRGMALYHPDDVAAYLQGKESPCRRDCGSMADIGSAERTTPISSMPTGTTSEQDQHVAALLARKYSPKRKGDSSPSSDRRSVTAPDLQIVS